MFIFVDSSSDYKSRAEEARKRLADLDAEMSDRSKDILESDVVKKLISTKEQINAENIYLKKKYKVSMKSPEKTNICFSAKFRKYIYIY